MACSTSWATAWLHPRLHSQARRHLGWRYVGQDITDRATVQDILDALDGL